MSEKLDVLPHVQLSRTATLLEASYTPFLNAFWAIRLSQSKLLWFTPAMERESEQMQAIRNQATYARPASGGDRSRFAYIYRELFS